MYKLFIADDEAIIREGLRCLLDWETLGFTIAGEAANGDAPCNFFCLKRRIWFCSISACRVCPDWMLSALPGNTAMTEKLLS